MVLPFRIIFLLHIIVIHKIFQTLLGNNILFYKLEGWLCNLVLIIFGVSYSLDNENISKK